MHKLGVSQTNGTPLSSATWLRKLWGRKWERNGLTMCEVPRPAMSTKKWRWQENATSPFHFIFLKKCSKRGSTRSPEFLLLVIKSPLLPPSSCIHGWKKNLLPAGHWCLQAMSEETTLLCVWRLPQPKLIHKPSPVPRLLPQTLGRWSQNKRVNPSWPHSWRYTEET